MPDSVNVSTIEQAGDIGGVGVSRIHWTTAAHGAGQPADVESVHLALEEMYTSLLPLYPGGITLKVQDEVRVLDVPSGRLTALVDRPTVGKDMAGLGTTTSYVAGMGARINWQTGIVVNHRLLHGATYIVPLDGFQYTGDGALLGSAQGTIKTAASLFIEQLHAIGLFPVVYHRPAKGTEVGGTMASVIAAVVPGTPAGLRSRRS